MLTTNVDIADRLINGEMGMIVKIDVNKDTKQPSIIYIKFDDSLAQALIDKSNNTFAKENRLVPIEPTLARFKILSPKGSEESQPIRTYRNIIQTVRTSHALAQRTSRILASQLRLHFFVPWDWM